MKIITAAQELHITYYNVKSHHVIIVPEGATIEPRIVYTGQEMAVDQE